MYNLRLGGFNHSTEPIDILLIVPEEKLDSWKPVLTLMLEQLIRSLMRRGERTYCAKEPLPALLVSIDEFNRLGRIPVILSGLATLRSRGVTIMIMVQSLAALEMTYSEVLTRAILENCCYLLILRILEPKSQGLISALVGSTSMVNMSSASSASLGPLPSSGMNLGINKTISHSLDRRPLIFPEALGTLDTVLCISPLGVFHAEKAPCY